MTTKADDIMYAIIERNSIQKIGEIDETTGKIVNPDIPKLTSMCYGHMVDPYLLRDLLKHGIGQEPTEDIFLATAEFMISAFDMRMKRTVHKTQQISAVGRG